MEPTYVYEKGGWVIDVYSQFYWFMNEFLSSQSFLPLTQII